MGYDAASGGDQLVRVSIEGVPGEAVDLSFVVTEPQGLASATGRPIADDTASADPGAVQVARCVLPDSGEAVILLPSGRCVAE